MIVIDACYAGQALHSTEKRRGPLNARGLVQLAYEQGIHLLAASQSQQQALETSIHGHGLLTHGAVIEGLEQGAADVAPQDGTITAAEWLSYAKQRVPALHRDFSVERSRGVRISPSSEYLLFQTPRTYAPGSMQFDRGC